MNIYQAIKVSVACLSLVNSVQSCNPLHTMLAICILFHYIIFLRFSIWDYGTTSITFNLTWLKTAFQFSIMKNLTNTLIVDKNFPDLENLYFITYHLSSFLFPCFLPVLFIFMPNSSWFQFLKNVFLTP